MQSQRAFLALCGVVIGAGVVLHDVHGLAVLRAVVLRALRVADDKVVDGVAVLAADGTDRAALGHGGRDVAREERALILGVGDVQHVGDRLARGVVDPDELHVRIFRRDGLDIIEFPADAHDDVCLIGGVLHLRCVVFIVALDGADLHAEVLGQTVCAFLGRVVERTVAERTGHDECELQVGGGVPLVFRLAAGGKDTRQQSHCQNACEDLFHK